MKNENNELDFSFLENEEGMSEYMGFDLSGHNFYEDVNEQNYPFIGKLVRNRKKKREERKAKGESVGVKRLAERVGGTVKTAVGGVIGKNAALVLAPFRGPMKKQLIERGLQENLVPRKTIDRAYLWVVTSNNRQFGGRSIQEGMKALSKFQATNGADPVTIGAIVKIVVEFFNGIKAKVKAKRANKKEKEIVDDILSSEEALAVGSVAAEDAAARGIGATVKDVIDAANTEIQQSRAIQDAKIEIMAEQDNVADFIAEKAKGKTDKEAEVSVMLKRYGPWVAVFLLGVIIVAKSGGGND